MDLYFSRRRFFETSFHAPRGKSEKDGFSDLREIYRVSTTVRRRSIFPDTTTIEYVAPDDEEKRHVIASISWGWPSQIASVIEIDGKRFMIKDFLRRDPNLLRTGTHLMIGEERFIWRSAVFRPPQLYDSQNRSVAQCIRPVRGLRPVSRTISVEPGCLHLEPDIATDTYVRDYVVASFFVYRACRDLRIICTPWWHQEEADFSGIRLRTQDFDKDDDDGDARCCDASHVAAGKSVSAIHCSLGNAKQALSLHPLSPPLPTASTEGSVMTDLYFSRRRFFQTGFYAACQKTTQGYTGSGGQFEEIYRVSTTVRKGSILPDTTIIEYVGSEDEEKHYVVATIQWHWPSQNSSIVEIDGHRLSLKEFMKREGILSTGTHVMIDEERFTWRSAVCRPAQLFNSQNHSVARLIPCPSNVHPFMRILVAQPSCLHLASELASDAYARDFAVVSFFVYRACRDLQILLTPWWRKKQADFSEMKLKA